MNALDSVFYEEAKQRRMITKEISAEEFHVLTYSIWALYYEPFYLGFSWEQIKRHAETISRFVDWHSALGMKKPK